MNNGNNDRESEPFFFDKDGEDDYNYRSNNGNRINNKNNTGRILNISDEEIRQLQQFHDDFLRNMSPIVHDGQGHSISRYTRRLVTGGFGALYSLVRSAFNGLSETEQNQVSNDF